MQRGKILIVEDDAFIRQLVRETVSLRTSHEVLEASNGQEALELVQTGRPEVVLLDINLGGPLDGLEVCRRVTANGSLRVIFISGQACRAEEGMEAGGCGFLSKPFSPLELIERIEAALREAS